MPNLWASGAYISKVSRALRSADSGETYFQVRALCKRSANLISKTRISRDIATIIFLTVSASAVGP